MRHVVAVAVVFLLAAGSLSAATFRTPADAELLGRADVVVVATVLSSVPREAAGRMVYTDHYLHVEEVLKGSIAGETVTVTELGGFAKNHGIAVPGSATYAPGTRVLAFLRHRDDGTLFTAFMGLGKYRFAQSDGAEVLVRDVEGLEVDDHRAFAARPAREFVQYIRDGAPATAAKPRMIEADAALEPKQAANGSAASYTISGGGRPLRWNCPSACTQDWTVGATPQAGAANSGLAVDRGMSAWTDEDDAWITLAANGSNSQTGVDNDDVNDIVFNSNDTNGFCDGGIGCAVIYFNGGPVSHVFDGSTFNDIVSSDVVVRPGDFGQPLLDAILGHELGHAIGLDHAPSGGALMSASVPSGATLREYDQEAVAEVYGTGLGCTVPNITGTSGSGSVFSGNSRNLSVSATGTTPFTYQWYAGTPSNTSTPLGTGNPYNTGPITENSKFWVRVTNECGSDDSGVIDVTVQSCDAPSITTQPENVSIAPSSSTTLHVGVAGTAPLFVQWYRGETGNTSNPVGTGTSFTTPTLTATTSYWARVTNDCGSDNSETGTVTVQPCTAPSITTQPASQNIQTNGTATLTVGLNGTSPFTIQWYRGTVGDTANPVGTNAASFTTPALQATTTYWVRITNCGGTVNSAAAVISVGPACVPVTISSLNTNVNVAIGETVTLTATTSGNAPVTFQWYQGDSGNVSTPVAGGTNAALTVGPFTTAGTIHYWVKATNACGTVNSATVNVTAACGILNVPQVSAPPTVHYTSGYTVQWTGNVGQTASFELQEATNPEFTAGLKTFIITAALSHPISAHTEIASDTRFYYRVRAIASCTQLPTAYSAPASTVVTRPEASNSTGFAISVPETATQSFTQDYLVPGFGATATPGDRFSITTDAPWLTVFPASGALSAGGTTVQLTVNPSLLEVGSTTASVVVTRTQGSGKGIVSNATSSSSVPVSISKVTPITPAPRSADAPPGTLLIPAIAHADGVNTRFQSDVRIVNASGNPISYDLSFTPSGKAGTETGKRTTLSIGPNESKGLDDVVKAWYGAGVLNELGLGTLEIRPLNNANPLATFASSRTYAISAAGTLGQFIPAIPLARFAPNAASDSTAKISLQQIANSPSYRTNLGFVEGSGTPVQLRITLRDGHNAIVKQVERSLPAYGHEQTNFAAVFGDIPLADGRVEVEVISTGGKVTAYASVVDNATSDPLMVFPVQAQKVSAQHYVVPGVAEFDNGPSSNFHTDMRIYNADDKPVTISLEYFPQSGDSTPRPPNTTLTLAAGEVKVLDNALPTLWTLARTAGAVAVDAPPASKLVITARTFSRDAAGGTYGQFIPGATSTDGVGLGERSLEVLQLEQSAQYRTNLGLVEVTGNPVKVEILARTGTKLTAVITADLNGNEYRQINRIFEALGLRDSVYTGRVSVRVIGGTGRIAAYGSVVDNRTIDPTYVPAQ
jgi:hypothetical protein